MTAVPLSSVFDEQNYGGKAMQLGAAIRAGLPVPDGFGLSAGFVDAIASGQAQATAKLEQICAQLPGAVAVRSSAVGEDSLGASFAGQHATVLNLTSPTDIAAAVLTVWKSARSDAAMAYRERLGADNSVHMGVVIQRLVSADVAGVMFTCNPVSGNNELVVEAAWGLGEIIVQGLVIPDFFCMDRAGRILESRTGFKDTMIQRLEGGRTHKAAVAAHLVEHPCLDAEKLGSLRALAEHCDLVFGPGPHDIEWALEGEELYLLQLRPVTSQPNI